MALTQQLARLSSSELAGCRESVSALHAICSFRTLPQSNYLDLDWAPALLQQAALAAGAPGALVDALRLATGGSDEVNPAYREAAESVFEHPVAANDPGSVREISNALQPFDPEDWLTRDTALAALGQRPQFGGHDDVYEYLSRHLSALRAFYADAAREDQAVIVWWD